MQKLYTCSHAAGNQHTTDALAPSPRTTAAAYNVPHPLESRMQLRIETVPGVRPRDVLKDCLISLGQVCDDLDQSWDLEVKAYEERNKGVDVKIKFT